MRSEGGGNFSPFLYFFLPTITNSYVLIPMSTSNTIVDENIYEKFSNVKFLIFNTKIVMKSIQYRNSRTTLKKKEE